MKESQKTKTLIIFISLALALSLFIPGTAFADDAVPPASEEPVQAPTEEPVADESLVPESSSTTPAILEQLPQDTGVVVVVNEQVEPLATQAAANAFVAGDPIWCELGVAPDPGDSRCSGSYANLWLLIDDIDTIAPARNGTIWIMGGNDNSSSDISIDNTTFAGWSNRSLTLQGGWDGVYGSIGTSGNSVFSVPISISGWNNAITINQITINATNGIGLEVQTTGSVSLNNVVSTNNNNAGIVADAGGNIVLGNVTASGNGLGGVAGSGAELTSTAQGVTLNGINTFNGNFETGLYVKAVRDITLGNVTASGNGLSGVTGGGADLTSTAGGVTLNGTNTFNGNFETGLYANASGDIVLGNVAANGNGSGADLTSTTRGVTLNGTNAFDNNLGAGLYVKATQDIVLGNVSASGNGLGGVTGGGADLTSTARGVTLNGTYVFDNNLEAGLYVESALDINAQNVTASNNGGSGADLNSLNSVFLLGAANIFDNNVAEGLLVDSGGDVFLENIASTRNAVGADLNLSGSLSISGVNIFNRNDGVGLYAEAGGDINAENITANRNGLVSGYGGGAELYALGDLFLNGNNVFNLNRDSGLYADAHGQIVAENVTASNNGGSGAEFFTLKSFTLSGSNVFNYNTLDGVFVNAVGPISMQNVTALSNGGSGISIDGQANAIVTCGMTDNNGWSEVEANLSGSLILAGVNFGNSIDDNLDVTGDRLILVSNGCFVYPQFGEGDDSGDEGDDGDSGSDGGSVDVNVVNVENGQTVKLECDSYEGNQLNTLGGGVYIPCPISDSARLWSVPSSGLPDSLSTGVKFISSLDFVITKDGVVYKPLKNPGSVSYVDLSANVKYSDTQVMQWNGQEWVDITDQINPFVSVFFSIPEDIKDKDLAILYWDEANGWVELSDGQDLGDGRLVQAAGFRKNGFFTAIVNFTGTFAFVQK